MNRSSPLVLAVLAPLLLAGCPSDPPAPDTSPPRSSTPASQPAEAPAPAKPASDATVYDVACGCSLADVGHCGEFAEVDGKFLPIEGELGLGSMPFCGKTGLKAKIEGKVEGDKLRATSLELIE